MPIQGMMEPQLPQIPEEALLGWEKIGEGSTGEVFKAVYRANDVALKRLKIDFINPKQKQALFSEAKKLAALKHRNIIDIHGVTKNGQVLVLEYCGQGSVDLFIAKYEPSLNMKIYMISEIIEGMYYLHCNEGFVHRDLKASNVLVDNSIGIKISDFGLSARRNITQRTSDLASGIGTLTHVPPEKLVNINLKPHWTADIFSFAILVWEILCEDTPYGESSNAEINNAVIRGSRPDLEDLPSSTPQLIRDLMTDAWKQNPAERPSFSDLRSRVQAHINATPHLKGNIAQELEDFKICVFNDQVIESTALQMDGGAELSSSPPGDTSSPISSHSPPIQESRQPVLRGSPLESDSEVFRSQSVCGEEPQTMSSIVHQETSHPESDRHPEKPPSIPEKAPIPPPRQKHDGKKKGSKSAKMGMLPPDFPRIPGLPPNIKVCNAGGFSGTFTQIGDGNKMVINQISSKKSKAKPKSRRPPPPPIIVSDPKMPVNRDDHMRKVSDGIGRKWRELGRKLSLTDADLYDIDSRFNREGVKEVVTQVLLKWQAKEGRQATLQTLVDKLCEVEEYVLAQSLVPV